MVMASIWTVPILVCLLAKTLFIFMQHPWPVQATMDNNNRLPGRHGNPLLFVPPRAYFLCWKGVCDPRLWDEMAKRAPAIYSFGLGKRSATGQDLLEEPVENDDDTNESPEDTEMPESGKDSQEPLHFEKRARYSFGMGKKDEPFHRFNFGLGKRDMGNRFAFGLGKRSDISSEDLPEEDEDQEQTDVQDQEVQKRKMDYNFGLGKRLQGDGNYEDLDADKRDKMYAFGLGKRNKMYQFGLGKRDKMYSFGLGKRTRQYAFGLGKRSPGKPDHLYSFGLGKRDAENMDYLSENAVTKRAQPYSFGLGKRNTHEWLTTSHVDKRGVNQGSKHGFHLVDDSGNHQRATGADEDDNRRTEFEMEKPVGTSAVSKTTISPDPVNEQP